MVPGWCGVLRRSVAAVSCSDHSTSALRGGCSSSRFQNAIAFDANTHLRKVRLDLRCRTRTMSHRLFGNERAIVFGSRSEVDRHACAAEKVSAKGRWITEPRTARLHVTPEIWSYISRCACTLASPGRSRSAGRTHARTTAPESERSQKLAHGPRIIVQRDDAGLPSAKCSGVVQDLRLPPASMAMASAPKK